jgi:hypothetical protein
MPKKIWQVNFKFNVSAEQYSEAVAPLADPVSEVQGLLWKIWIVNAEESEAGGIHLFADQASLEAHAGGEIINGILNHPALSDFDVKTFDVMEENSRKTRAPLSEEVTA